MAAPWAADVAIDAALARDLVAEQFPALRDAPLRPFGEGWDNAAFLVDERFVFRFPRRTAVAHLIAREAALLPRIAPAVPFAVPAPAYVGTPTERYPYTFAGYPLLRGTTLDRAAASPADRAALAAPLGAALRALHAFDIAPFDGSLPPDEIGRLDHAKRLPLARERLTGLHERGLIDDPQPLLAELARIAPLDDARGDTLVHGDLYERHVVVADGALVGFIDWGDVHRGDPALDLAIAFLVLPPAAHAAFRAAYGPIDGRTWDRARYRAIYHAALFAAYGVEIDDAAASAAGIAALAALRDQVAQ